jgi:hypothetical protein
MFCPGCGSQVNEDDFKFCRQCGANLRGVREAMTSRSTGEKFDWSRTWLAEMLYHKEELERLRGVTPEEKLLKEEKKRLDEIKGGVITSLVGVGVMIVFYLFFDIVAKHKSPGDAEIVRNLWLLGIIPTLVGVGLLINGFFVSRRLVKLKEQLLQTAPSASQSQAALPAKTTDQLIFDAAPFTGSSVTEDPTAHLPEAVRAPLRHEAD